MRTALLVMVSAAAACVSSGTSNGAPEPDLGAAGLVIQQDTILKSASLLRRLAEAADGYRDGKQRYVVAALEFPHKVLGVFLNKDRADSIATSSTTGTLHYATFGPYRTAVEAGVAEEVDNVKYVVVYYADGDSTMYDGQRYDALFWGMSAFDKFVAPYVTEVSGAPYAASQRQAYKAGELTNSVLPHKRYSF